MGMFLAVAGAAGIGFVAHKLTQGYYLARIQHEADWRKRADATKAKWEGIKDQNVQIDGVWYRTY